MRSLKQALLDYDLIVLRVMGEWWELDLTGEDKSSCVEALTERLAQLEMREELQYLPPEEGEAVHDLIANNGRLPVATFARKHGEVRLMGPGRMEREEPWFDPISAAEALWYRGLLYRGFDETAEGLIEFYYLPDELMAQFPAAGQQASVTDTTVATLPPTAAPNQIETAVTDAVDDLATILIVAQQSSFVPDAFKRLNLYLLNTQPDRRSLLLMLAQEMGLIRPHDDSWQPTRTAVNWLKQSREAQLRALVDAWSSSHWNDLCHTPDLTCEGESWLNDPILARSALLESLPRSGDWFSLDDFTNSIKENNPDFQRPDGNYDTWYIRDNKSADYITGYENWERVEGRLIRFVITGPLYWLGMVELGDGHSFRLMPRALAWLVDRPPAQEEVQVPMVVESDGRLIVPHNADRAQRFQTARISEPEPMVDGRPYAYRLTPQSLSQAREQGITPDRVLQFLEKASSRPVPTSVRRAITRWGEHGVEGRLEEVVILRVREASILKTLHENPKTRHLLGESLGELATAVRLEDWQELRRAVAQLGLFLDSDVLE
jgi:hypothetical protein